MSVVFDRDLIEKCQTNAPRYTSYPTADRFILDYQESTLIKQLNTLFNVDYTDEMISLYIHIPFCNTLCLYCACNKIITNDRSNIAKYLLYLEKEINLYARLINKTLKVVQLHFGGGSPSWMSINEVSQLMGIIRKNFNLDKAHEVSMEIDPRHCDYNFIKGLRDNGFNRISIGLQDLHPKVQKAVNRVQTFESSREILDAGKSLGFLSTNVDLIYGLPFQTLDSFTRTIDQVLELAPDRIALFNYAHIPNMFMSQTRINEVDLPSPSTKLDILHMSVDKFSHHGYEFIGMDHFALKNDELAIALRNGTLQRNFQGYSTFAGANMLSFGVSSIGFIEQSYYQNVKDLESYYLALEKGCFPIMRGVVLTDDDILRKYVIGEIMCQYGVNYTVIENKFDIDFKEYFAHEMLSLEKLLVLELIEFNLVGFSVTDKGKFLIRNVAVVFDKYLQTSVKNTRYSKVI